MGEGALLISGDGCLVVLGFGRGGACTVAVVCIGKLLCEIVHI